MSRPRYLVIGRHVFSITDGQRHFVNCVQLAGLYGVDTQECVLVNQHADTLEARERAVGGLHIQDYIVLEPREDGDYSLPVLQEGPS